MEIMKNFEGKLLQAGLSLPMETNIGKKFRFSYEEDLCFTVLLGSIQSIVFSKERGLEIFVSNQFFRGMELICFSHSNLGWSVICADENGLFEVFDGKLKLF